MRVKLKPDMALYIPGTPTHEEQEMNAWNRIRRWLPPEILTATNHFLWSGIYRRGFPTVVVDATLTDWALPLSVHLGGPLLGKFGVTVRIGPVNIGWSRL